MKIKDLLKVVLTTLIIGSLILYIGIKPRGESNPVTGYRVYLDGEKIGTIKEKQDLLNKINLEQEEIKNKYRVDNVYPPTGLEIVKYVTYNNDFSKIDDIYKNINEFSIKGYVVTIDSPDEDVENKKLYILNKEDFNESMQKLITAFIQEDKYNKFVSENQSPIMDTGEYIENIYLQEKITIKEGFIGTDENILTSTKEISRYLLYSTLEDTDKYTVKAGDTIESIAQDNELNVTEFLIANPQLSGVDALLSANGDQTVNVSLIKPLVNIIMLSELIEKQVASFETIVKYSQTMNIGTSYIEQDGENGVAKVKFKVKYNNGVIEEAVKISATELTPAINKVVIKGGYKPMNFGVGDIGEWARPTVNYCLISSPFGARWGAFHDAIDISGCGGLGSPIFAANDGVVITSEWSSGNPGLHIRIDHQNGYYTSYLHLSETFVKVGQTVNKGDRIGSMGKTGRASGVHLHFSVYYIPGGNGFIYDKQYAVNPVNISPLFRY